MEKSAKEPVYWIVAFLFLVMAFYLHGPFSHQWADGFAGYWGQ